MAIAMNIKRKILRNILKKDITMNIKRKILSFLFLYKDVKIK